MQAGVLQTRFEGPEPMTREVAAVGEEAVPRRVPALEPAQEELASLEARGKTTMGLVELLLKQPAGVDELNRQARWQRALFPRFLLISEISFFFYVLIMVLLL